MAEVEGANTYRECKHRAAKVKTNGQPPEKYVKMWATEKLQRELPLAAGGENGGPILLVEKAISLRD